MKSIISAEIARSFEVRHYTGDDGYPKAGVFDVVYVETTDGKHLFLSNVKTVSDEEGFTVHTERYDVEVLLEKVRARGVVDETLWVDVTDEVNKTFEERMDEAWAYEVRDRYDHGDFRFAA